MGSELKRPVWAFAVVSLLCAVLMIVSTGRVDAVLGVFDAPRPISAPAPTSVPAAETAAVLPDTPAAVSVPDELMAALTWLLPAATPEKPRVAATTDKASKKAGRPGAHLTPRSAPARR